MNKFLKSLTISLCTLCIFSCASSKRPHEDKGNVFYYGEDNRLFVPSENNSRPVVTLDHGELIKVNDTSYIVRPYNPVTTVCIKSNRKVREKRYHSINIPAPYPILYFKGDHKVAQRSGIIGHMAMRDAIAMITVIENFDFACRFTLVNFDLTRITKENKIFRLVKATRWPDCVSLTHNADAGDTFIISNVKVLHMESGNIIKAQDRVITITD